MYDIIPGPHISTACGGSTWPIKIRRKGKWWRKSWRQRSLIQWCGSFALQSRLREQKSTFLSYTHIHIIIPPWGPRVEINVNKTKIIKEIYQETVYISMFIYLIHSISFGPHYNILKPFNLNCYSYPISLIYAPHMITKRV